MSLKSIKPAAVLKWRKKQGYSQAEAARILNAPTGTYINWEKGRRSVRPYVALLLRYVEKYGVIDD